MLEVRLTDSQFTAISEYLRTLIEQHSQLMVQVNNVWIALAVFAAIGIAFIAAMLFAAAWSVKTVNNRQSKTEEMVLDLTGKFNLLIDILLEEARQRKGNG
jgi:hypothetical protein